MTKTAEQNHKRNKRWAVITGAVLFLVLAPTLVGYLFWARALPDWSPPPHLLPDDNAYDRYAAAALSIADGPTSPDLLDPNTSLKVLREVVDRDKHALDRIRAAFGEPCVVPRWFRFYYSPPELSQLRQAARLFVAEGRSAMAAGSPGEAAQRYLDAIELGGNISRDAGLYLGRYSTLICWIGARPLERIVVDLSVEEAGAALERLNRVDSDWGSSASHVEAVKIETLAELQKVCRSQSAFRTILFAFDQPRDLELMMVAVQAEFYPRRLTHRNLERYFEHYISQAGVPSHSRAGVALPSDPLGEFLVPLIHLTVLDWNIASSHRGLLRLMLALRVYRGHKGSYPDNLDQLTELLGGTLPLDPFDNQPYHYTLTEDGHRLWSIGPDGIDDNGEIALTRGGFWDGRGDLVAGQLFR